MTAVRRFVGLFIEPVPATSSAAADAPPSPRPTFPAAAGAPPSPRPTFPAAAGAPPSPRPTSPAGDDPRPGGPAPTEHRASWSPPRAPVLAPPHPARSAWATPPSSSHANTAGEPWPQAVAATASVPLRAAVVGTSERAVAPVAAAVAAELRVRARAPAALVALWRPGAPARTPVGAALPAARRLATGLTTEGHRTTACARLAWVALPDDPTEAADGFRRLAAHAGVPVVLGLCGPRPDAFEPLLAEHDATVAVLPADADAALRTLAFLALPTPVRALHAPLPAGPPRWAAMAGFGRLRSLPALARDGAGA